ncbi:MAG: tRNA lysidine(34) synthetase TilS [Trichloromonas sp.]|jgi:tRNA(Ile)-lysidine synthase|nr:tRNA lysidine(34) synthetase TilS [Trichloromonas sp.]
MDKLFIENVLQRQLLAPGERVLTAVSGGADSVALLVLLQRNAEALGIEVAAAHLDHRMRPESGEDAEFVRRLCLDLDIPLHIGTRDVPKLSQAWREGLEASARRARREFLVATAAARGCVKVALGHHRGDQAETLLHRLLRGSGSSGLSAMQPWSPPFIRPLLPFAREQLREFLAEQGCPFIDDASNRDPRFTRNRIRHQLLPLLESFNPRVEEHLCRLSERLSVEEDFWREREDGALKQVMLDRSDGLSLSRGLLLQLHPALLPRVLRRALAEVRGDLQGIASCHLSAVRALAESEHPQGELDLPGAWIGRRYERLWLRRERPLETAIAPLTISGPGKYALADGGELQVSVEGVPGGETALVAEFDGFFIDFPLQWRPFCPGDRFHPDGAPGGKKLKSFFIDQKMEKEKRHSLWLLAADEVLWVAGVRRCHGYRPEAACERVLRFVYRPGKAHENGL